VPCSAAAAAAAAGVGGDAGDRVVATYAAASPVGGSRESLPGAAATVLTPGECTCNNIGMDGGIVLTASAANHYYTHLPSSANQGYTHLQYQPITCRAPPHATTSTTTSTSAQPAPSEPQHCIDATTLGTGQTCSLLLRSGDRLSTPATNKLESIVKRVTVF